MKINSISGHKNLSFKADWTKDVEKQFVNGLRRYKYDEKALNYYKDRIQEVKETAPGITVKSMGRMNCATGIPGYSNVVLDSGKVDYFCTWKNPELRYEQCLKTVNLCTLDGITALCKSLKSFVN